MKHWLLVVLGVAVVLSTVVEAKVIVQTVQYRQGPTLLEGVLAYKEKGPKKRPGIVLFHQKLGITAYEKMRARQLAEEGYVVLTADIFGKDIRPTDDSQAAQEVSKYHGDRGLLRARAKAGFNFLKQFGKTDASRIAAVGYGFGGQVALELARSGEMVKAVVSVHGNLETPEPDEARNITAEILVEHGGDDPFVPWSEVTAFKDEMDKANVPYQLNVYSDAVHAFTIQNGSHLPATGVAYNAKADRRAWRDMILFLREIV
ncbi:MAG: dienelactone hydrolase family protein [Candidatus Margulisiibacteriota bacterium]